MTSRLILPFIPLRLQASALSSYQSFTLPANFVPQFQHKMNFLAFSAFMIIAAIQGGKCNNNNKCENKLILRVVSGETNGRRNAFQQSLGHTKTWTLEYIRLKTLLFYIKVRPLHIRRALIYSAWFRRDVSCRTPCNKYCITESKLRDFPGPKLTPQKNPIKYQNSPKTSLVQLYFIRKTPRPGQHTSSNIAKQGHYRRRLGPGGAPPERGTFSRAQVNEVYKLKGQGNLPFRSVKRPQRSKRRIYGCDKVEKNLWFCDLFIF